MILWPILPFASRDCVTEFGCQGLELDGALLAWGTDFVRDAGAWDQSRARKYQYPNRIRDFRTNCGGTRIAFC